MKNLLLSALVACSMSSLVFAQVVPAAKESGHAAAETAKEGGDNLKAATESQPNKAIDKAKAHAHKAKAHAHRHHAKADAKAAVH